MGFQDTSLGGPGREFPRTTLGMASLLQGPDRRAAVEALSRRYWKPIYSYLVASLAKSSEDAKDLTQAFLMWILEEDVLEKFEPVRGSFRGYLRVILRSFVGHQERALQAFKRGGGRRTLPEEELRDLPDPRTSDPEQAFDRAMRSEMIEGAIDRVRLRWHQRGNADGFRLYEEHDLVPEEGRPTYERLAERTGRTPHQVEHAVTLVRGEIREELRAELAQLTTDPRSLEEEWGELFG